MRTALFSSMIVFLSISNASETKAQGVHFGAGALHVDIGNPHFVGGWHGARHRSRYGNYGAYQVYNRGLWGGHHRWHDTSHFDYHPGGFVRHRNHYDYMPGHYDFHQTGRWDHGH